MLHKISSLDSPTTSIFQTISLNNIRFSLNPFTKCAFGNLISKMRKLLFRLILLALIGGGGIFYYIWQQATKLPDEYVEAVEANKQDVEQPPLQASQIASQANESRNKLTKPLLKAKVGQKVVIKLTDRDLNNLAIDKLASFQSDKRLPSGVSGMNTKIKDGKIYAGALVDLDRLARDGKPGTKVGGLTKITDKLPFLKNRSIYVGIVGQPMFDGSHIEFDESTQIKVGNMNFTITQLAENLGVAPEKIQQAIDLKIKQKNLKIDRINLENDGLKIEGAKK
jgi:hypothetical protein